MTLALARRRPNTLVVVMETIEEELVLELMLTTHYNENVIQAINQNVRIAKYNLQRDSVGICVF